jgi:hypothetical protein
MYVQDYDFPSSSKYLIELDVQEKVLHVRLFEKLYKYISYTSHFQIHHWFYIGSHKFIGGFDTWLYGDG